MAKGNSFPNSAFSYGVGDDYTTGDVYYVDSGATNASDGNDGKAPGTPLATLDGAIGKCTASNGDIIFVMPGHAETLTAQISLDVAGVKIKGLGVGQSRPAFTANFSAAGDTLDVSADDCQIHNLRFVASSASQTSQVNVDADDFEMHNCIIEQGASNLIGVTIADGAHRFVFKDCLWLGTAAGPDYSIFFDSASDIADDWLVEGCTFNYVNSAGLDLGHFYCVNIPLGYVIKDCVMIGADTVALDFNSQATSGIGADGFAINCQIVPSSSVATIANLVDAGGTAFVNVRVHNAQDSTSGALIPATTAS